MKAGKLAAVLLTAAAGTLVGGLGWTLGNATLPIADDGQAEGAARSVADRAAEARGVARSFDEASGAARDVYRARLADALGAVKRESEVAGEPEIASAAAALGVGGARGETARALERLELVARAAANERAADRMASRARAARDGAVVALGGALALVGAGLAAFTVAARRSRRESEALAGVLPQSLEADEDLAARAARLRGKADRLSARHERAVASNLDVSRALEAYEVAQTQFYAAQDALTASLGEARSEVERLKVSSMVDELTGALKYPYLVHRVRELLQDLLERSRPFCLLELDLDNFKDINDTYGHAAGDDALKDFASLLRSACRESDVVIRKSGDEFFVVAPETAHDEAVALGERLREAVNGHTVVSTTLAGDRYEFPLGASIGVLDPSQADLGALRGLGDPDLAVREIISYVDAALYLAKHSGRDCVRGYQAGMRVVDVGKSDVPAELQRINRLARSRYASLAADARDRVDALLVEASELLFPKRRGGRAGGERTSN